MTPTQKIVEALRAADCDPKRSSSGWSARCPAHDDRTPSLSIGVGDDGRALLTCHAGCKLAAIVAALSLTEADLFPTSLNGSAGVGRLGRGSARRKRDFGRLAHEVADRLGDDALQELADSLNVAPEALEALGFGDDGAGGYAWPERDGAGAVVGVGVRDSNGKRCYPGSKRGLIFDAATVEDGDDPLIIVEGGSDCAAGLSLGLRAVGIPQAGGTGDSLRWLCELLGRIKPTSVIVVGDADSAGERGAAKVAHHLAGRIKAPVHLAPTPGDALDLRDLLGRMRAEGLDLGDAEGRRKCGAVVLNEIAAAPVVSRDDGDEDEPEAFPIEDGFPPALAPLRDYYGAVAHAMQIPFEAVAMLGVAIATTGSLRKIEIDCGLWREPAPLWALVLMPTGERKTALLKELTAAIAKWERDEAERLAPEIARSATEKKIAAAGLKRLEDRAAKSGLLAHLAEAGDAAAELTKIKEVSPPRLRVVEATPEALAVSMQRNGERAIVVSAEGDAVDVVLGRYSDRANLGVFLSGHAGDALNALRIGRESVCMERPALSLALIVQPEAMADCYESRAARGRGFLSRFLACSPASQIGSREITPKPVPGWLRDPAWSAPMRVMLDWAMPGEDGEPVVASFDADGQRMFDAFRAELEPRLCPQTGDLGARDHVRGWASKLPGAVARLALVFECFAAAVEGRSTPPAIVRSETVAAAMAWAPWLIAQRDRAEREAVAAGDPDAADAAGVGLSPELRKLKAWITKRGGSATTRELSKSGPRRFRGDRGAAQAALDALSSAGGFRWEYPSQEGAGMPKAPRLMAVDSTAPAIPTEPTNPPSVDPTIPRGEPESAIGDSGSTGSILKSRSDR